MLRLFFWSNFWEIGACVKNILASCKAYILINLFLGQNTSLYDTILFLFLLLLGIVESPKMEGEANAVGYLKDHYQACKNTCK